MDVAALSRLRDSYRDELLNQTIPFWVKHGVDREHGGLLTCLAEDGSVVDTDKAVWLQGRAAWMFSTLCLTVERRPEWMAIAHSCLRFLRERCRGDAGKLYFQVTRDGQPLRMRRYAFSECFGAIAGAVGSKLFPGEQWEQDGIHDFARFLHYAVDPGATAPKLDPRTRSLRGIGPYMMVIAVGQEMRAALGDIVVSGATFTQWIDRAIEVIRRDFYRPELSVVLENVGPDGAICDHFDGRTLNPGHAIECGWFILHEAKLRQRDPRLVELGTGIIDCMWERGWDPVHGGLFSFVDLKGLPVQEYAAQMKFWWPHNEAEIAMLLAWQLTGDARYARWHGAVRDWSRRVFADPKHGEWFGYAHRHGEISTRLKGNLWKGPFHLPRMLWYCWRLSDELIAAAAKSPATALVS